METSSRGPEKKGGSAIGRSLKDCHILIVDDDEDAREILTHVLEDSGAIVRAASNAEQAIELIGAEPPELLISDIGMPGVDGYELIHRVRAGGLSGAQLPAIALTAFSRDVDRRLAQVSGFQTFMTKPVERATLLNAIAALIA